MKESINRNGMRRTAEEESSRIIKSRWPGRHLSIDVEVVYMGDHGERVP